MPRTANAEVEQENMTSVLSMVEIGVNDSRFLPNSLCSRIKNEEAGVSFVNDKVCIVPHFFDAKYHFASITLMPKEFLELLQRQAIHIITDADVDSEKLPTIGQRLPSADRAKNILAAWTDTSWVPDEKLETIRLFAFNVKVTPSGGIELTPDSLLVIVDGGGRTAAAMKGINDILNDDDKTMNDHVIATRRLVFQLNIDLSGNLSKAVQEFLLHNRDAKRTSRGTNLCAENTLLEKMAEEGRLEEAANFDSPNWSAYVLRRLNSEWNHGGSLLEFLPWGFEGKAQNRKLVKGRAGKLSSLQTVLDGKSGNEVKRLMKQHKIAVNELPDVLNFFLTEWRNMLPTACNEMMSNSFSRMTAETPQQAISPRVVTSLGLRLMLVVSVVAYSKSRKNGKMFREICEKTFNEHFRRYDADYPNKGKRKKMSVDDFWYENRWFNSASFNSGAQNTRVVISQFVTSANDVIAKI